MSIRRTLPSARLLLATFLSFLLAAALALSAAAQQVLVQNGATAQVSNGGVWHLQGGTMDFGDSGATARLKEVSSGRVTGGLLIATRALNSPSSANPAGLGAVLSASVDLGNVTVTRGHAAQTGSGNQSIERYYDISPSKNNSGLSATLTHAYADAELNGLSESNLELFKSTDGGSTWSEKGYDSRDAQANTVTLSGISSFSRWTLGSSSSPLPVELASFEGTAAQQDGGEAVRLTWKTASETGNAGFEIQRKSGDGEGWTQVGYRQSKAAGGTSTGAQVYQFTDERLPYGADTLSYRLRQVDTDGSVHPSAPITVARGAVKALELKETYPNPASGHVTIRYAAPPQENGSNVTLRLYNVLGQKVRRVRRAAGSGRHKAQIDVRGLASGTYFLRLTGGGVAKTQRLTVVR